MRGIFDQFVQGVVLILGLALSVKLSPYLVGRLPEEFRTDLSRTISVVVIYAAILVVLGLVRAAGPLRRLFVRSEAFVGWYISAHVNNDLPIVSFFEFSYNPVDRRYEIFGTAVDVSNRMAPSGYWSSTAIDLDLAHRTITYIYVGGGRDVRLDGDAHRSLGLAFVEFMDSRLEFGRGHFRDDLPNAKDVDTEVVRLTPTYLNRLLGKKLKRIRNFDDMYEVACAYRAARFPVGASTTKPA